MHRGCFAEFFACKSTFCLDLTVFSEETEQNNHGSEIAKISFELNFVQGIIEPQYLWCEIAKNDLLMFYGAVVVLEIPDR